MTDGTLLNPPCHWGWRQSASQHSSSHLPRGHHPNLHPQQSTRDEGGRTPSAALICNYPPPLHAHPGPLWAGTSPRLHWAVYVFSPVQNLGLQHRRRRAAGPGAPLPPQDLRTQRNCRACSRRIPIAHSTKCAELHPISCHCAFVLKGQNAAPWRLAPWPPSAVSWGRMFNYRATSTVRTPGSQ